MTRYLGSLLHPVTQAAVLIELRPLDPQRDFLGGLNAATLQSDVFSATPSWPARQYLRRLWDQNSRLYEQGLFRPPGILAPGALAAMANSEALDTRTIAPGTRAALNFYMDEKAMAESEIRKAIYIGRTLATPQLKDLPQSQLTSLVAWASVRRWIRPIQTISIAPFGRGDLSFEIFWCSRCATHSRNLCLCRNTY